MLISRNFALGLFFAVALAGSANAATTASFSSYQKQVNPGEVLISDFSGSSAPGFTITGTASLVAGHHLLCSRPAVNAEEKLDGQYLCIKLGQYEQIENTGLDAFSFYAGSLDSWNKVEFTHRSGTVESFSGADVARMAGSGDNGAQHSPMENGRYTFKFDDPVTRVRLSSSFYSFEVLDLGGVPSVANR